MTGADSPYYTADLSLPNGLTRLKEAYRKIRGEFDAICAALDSPLRDAIQDFYSMMGPWAQEERSDLLFTRYPPEDVPASMPHSALGLDDALSRFAFDAGQER